jgi:hypothetical protein
MSAMRDYIEAIERYKHFNDIGSVGLTLDQTGTDLDGLAELAKQRLAEVLKEIEHAPASSS